MPSPRRPHSFRYRLRESLLMLSGRIPKRLTAVDALTTAQGELAQARVEIDRLAKAAAVARTRLFEMELEMEDLRKDNDRLRMANTALAVELSSARTPGPLS